MDAVNEFIAQAAASPWVYLVVFAVVLVDAFFPPVPSESVVIAAAAAAVAVGTPSLPLVIACAAAGAIAGDNLTYAIGRRVPIERLRFLRGPRMSSALARARQGIHRRTAVLLLSARYVPVGRVAVNLMAGASRVPAKRFLFLSSLAGASWAVYSVTVGVVAAHWLGGNAFLAMIVGIALGISAGIVLDAVLRAVSRRRERRTPPVDPAPVDTMPVELAERELVSHAEEVGR